MKKSQAFVMPAGKKTRAGTRSHVLKGVTEAAAYDIARAPIKHFGDVLPEAMLIARWRRCSADALAAANLGLSAELGNA
jgi:hypothetical protein